MLCLSDAASDFCYGDLSGSEHRHSPWRLHEQGLLTSQRQRRARTPSPMLMAVKVNDASPAAHECVSSYCWDNARLDIVNWIKRFHNARRMHSAMG